MAISIVGTGTVAATAGSTNLAPGIPASTLQNDVLLLFIYCREATRTIGTPTGWADLLATTSTANGTVKICWMRRGASAPTAPSVTQNSTATTGTAMARIRAYRGVVLSGNPWDILGTVETEAAGSPVSNGGVTTATAAAMVIAFFAKGDGGNNTTNDYATFSCASLTGITGVANGTTAGNDAAVGIADGEKVAAGATGAFTATCTLNFTGISYTFALKPEPVAVTHNMDGTVVGSGSVSGDPIKTAEEGGTAAGSGGASGDPDVQSGSTTHQMDGTAVGSGVVTGAPTKTVHESGTAAGVGGASGAPTKTVQEVGTVQGAGAVAGSSTKTVQETGTVQGSGSGSGAPTKTVQETGTTAGIGTVSGSPAKEIHLAGTVGGVGEGTGDPTKVIPVAGTVGGVGQAGGDPSGVVQTHQVSGTVIGAGSASGDPIQQVQLDGTIEHDPNCISGDPSTTANVQGTVAGIATLTGSPASPKLEQIAGTAHGQAALSGAITVLLRAIESGTLVRAMETVRKSIAKYGTDMSLVLFVDAAPADLQKPWRVESPTEVVQIVKGVFLKAKRQQLGKNVDNRLESDGLQHSEKRILIAAKGLTNAPSLKGEIRVGDVRWAIISIAPLEPAGESILYTLQVRQ